MPRIAAHRRRVRPVRIAERCAEWLLQAREEAGVDHVFLFPAHNLAGGYAMPEPALQAFAKIIRPRLGG